MTHKKNRNSSLNKDFRFYFASNLSMTPNPDLEHATSKLPSCGDPGLPRPLPAQRERKVSPHRRKKRGRRSFERTAARRSRMKSKRRFNRQCFRTFAKYLPPRKLDLVATQLPHLATQEARGQTINKTSIRPHVAFRNGRRKLKLLLRQRQNVSPQVKKDIQEQLDRLSDRLPYGRTLRVGSCNVQGLKITDRQNLIQVMINQKLDILCNQETHVNHCSIEEHDGFWFVFSSEISNPLEQNAAREFAGVGFIVSPDLWRFVSNFDTIDSRISRMSLRCHGNPVHLFSVYAPHSGRPSGEKDRFYHNLRQTLRQTSDAEIRLIFGDFNARLHCVLDDDKPQVGSHILGRGFGFLNNVSPNTLENREPFVDFLKSEDFWAMNTHFQKHNKSLCIFSEVSNTEGGPPWDATGYAQIDYSLAPSRWKSIVQNVEALPDV